MRSLIIGGAGFIGANLAEKLTLGRHEVVVLDLPSALEATEHAINLSDAHRRRLLSQTQCIPGDVRDKDTLATSIGTAAPSTIYYLAALPILSLAETQFVSASGSMIRGLANALEVARSTPDVNRFVYVSSSMVYGDFDSDPVPERAIMAPLNLYGGFKLAGEHLVRAYLASTDVEPVVVRPSGVYGPGDSHDRVVRKFCTAALSGGEIRATNAADTLIDFTWIGDLIDGLALAGSMAEAAGETFNLTRGHARSLDELIHVVGELRPGAKVLRSGGRDRLRPRRGTLDISKARRLLGYDPQVDLEVGVIKYARHLAEGQQASMQEHVAA